MKSKRFRLNSLDQHFLAYETSNHSFVSHVILENEIPFEKEQTLQATLTLLKAIPYLRSRFEENYRITDGFPETKLEELAKKAISEVARIKRRDLSDTLPTKIAIYREYCFKFTLGSFDEDSHFLAISAHHTAMDGMGQALFAQEFLAAYQNLPISDWADKDQNFTFQKALTKRFSFIARAQFFLKSFSYLLKRSGNHGWANSLITNGATQGGKLKCVFIPIDEKEALLKKRSIERGFSSVFAFVLYSSLKAFAAVTEQNSNRVTVITPVNLRHAFRERKSFQNIDGLARVHVRADEILSTDFSQKIESLVKSEITAEKAFSLILLLGLASRFLPLAKLKSIIQKQEGSSGPVNSSIFLSFGNFPRFKMKLKRVYGFGSLTRSPGVGIILVGLPGKQVLSVEYLEELIPEAKVDAYTRALCLELFAGPADYF